MDFRNKKIAILGLGVEGLDLIEFLLPQRPRITGFDIKSAKELSQIIPRLKKMAIKLNLGSDYLRKGLLDFDFIFCSPAIKPTLPELIEAKKAKIPVSSATKIFFDLCPAKIIGVTGTKGKGTTATLIFKILQKSGKKVFLVGNIGNPPLKLLPLLRKESWVVFELSSFQLQDLTRSPQVAVVLFITSEHLDYHPSTKAYIKAKTAVVKFQKYQDMAIINADSQTACQFAQLSKGKIFYFSRAKKTNGAYINHKKEIVLVTSGKEIVLGKTMDLKLLGEHNWDNVLAAVIASDIAGADLKSIRKIIFSFSGLDHRLELVAKIEGVSFYNDSSSTTPETTIAAIKSFEQPLVLVVGGSEKGSDFTQLGQEIMASSTKALFLIGATRERIKQAIIAGGFQGKIVEGLKSMEEIVKTAFEIASPGEIVLLSPACASFDMYRNYQDRGEQFEKAVSKLKVGLNNGC